MDAKLFIGGLVTSALLLGSVASSVWADVKVLQYNADGTVKGIKSSNGKSSKSKSGGAAGQAAGNGFSPDGNFVEGELIVVNPSRHFEINAEPMGFDILERQNFPQLKLSVLRLRTPSKYSVPEAKTYLAQKFPRLNVDANHTYDITGLPEVSPEAIEMAALATSPASCGKGLRIGMVDSGVNSSHPALRGQKIVSRRFAVKGTKSGPSIHGTAIASLFVGKMAKQGLGGFLPSAEIRVANVQEVSPSRKIVARASSLLDAIDWLASERVHVINFNIAGADNVALRAAVDRAQKMGLIMVAAVGNWKTDSAKAFPAAYSSVIGVTSIDKNDNIYSRANKGGEVDFAAQGVRVWAAGTSKGGQFMSGTSYATPMISSLIALHVATGKKTSPEAARTYLRQYAVDLGSSGKDPVFGWGKIEQSSLCK